ncbi:MAG: hypothetical protein HY796_00010 [Elusimicrobia bacterium]|nr:hypothetical protein [Elusimicrobiota bacterium]
MTDSENIVLQDADCEFLHNLSLWLNKKSWRLWTLAAVSLLLAEIGREIYLNWGLEIFCIMYILFLSPVLSFPFLVLNSSKMIKTVEKMRE